MTEWTSCLCHHVLRVFSCATAVFLLNYPSELSLAQPATETTVSLNALKEYLNEECDVAPKISEVCGVKRLIPYKDDAALKQKLLDILTNKADEELLQMAQKRVDKQWRAFNELSSRTSKNARGTMTKDIYFNHHLELILRIYHEKAAYGLATIDPEEAERVLIEADRRDDQALAHMLRVALFYRP